MKALCRFCDEEFIVQEKEGEEVAKKIIEHIIQKHPEHGSELKLKLQSVANETMKDYVIFQKEDGQ